MACLCMNIPRHKLHGFPILVVVPEITSWRSVNTRCCVCCLIIGRSITSLSNLDVLCRDFREARNGDILVIFRFRSESYRSRGHQIRSGAAPRRKATSLQATRRLSTFIFSVREPIQRGGMAVSGLHRRSGAPTETLPGRKAETD